jgi:hypothetical protein
MIILIHKMQNLIHFHFITLHKLEIEEYLLDPIKVIYEKLIMKILFYGE